MHRRLPIFPLNIGQRKAGWLALLGQLVALCGIPLPAPAAKDTSQPFPCQARRCGCLSAADCWTQCCCFSAQERLAWAQQRAIETPESLAEEAAAETGDCCASHGEQEPATESNHCKKMPQGPTPQSPSPEESPERLPGADFALGFMVRHCQGLGSIMNGGEPAAPPAPPVSWAFEWHAFALGSPVSVDPITLTCAPSEPPPRA